MKWLCHLTKMKMNIVIFQTFFFFDLEKFLGTVFIKKEAEVLRNEGITNQL